MKFLFLNVITNPNFSRGIRPIYMDGVANGGGGGGSSSVAAAAGPLQPTQVVRQGNMPGNEGLKSPSRAQLATNLLLNLCIHGAHKYPDNSSQDTKQQWVDYMNQQFNIGNIVDGPTPCQIYELWRVKDAHLKMKERLLKIGAHYSDLYLARKARDGDHAQFTDAEVYGHRMIQERKEAHDAHAQAARAQNVQREQLQQNLVANERYMNLASPGRGVVSPAGATTNENDLIGLAALAQQPSSSDDPFDDIANAHRHAARVALQEQYDAGIMDVQDISRADGNTGDAEVEVLSPTPNFNYPAASNVRQRYNLEAGNAEAAGAAAVAASMQRNGNGSQGSGSQSSSGGGQPTTRDTPKHQDINSLCETYTKEVRESAALTRGLIGTLSQSFQRHPLQPQPQNQLQQPQQPITSQSSNADSPDTREKKRMNKIRMYEGMEDELKAKKKKMQDDECDASEIEELEDRIKGYKKLRRNLEAEMFAETD